jgi:hypothetical protein
LGKAADLKAHVDETIPPIDPSLQAPDVEPGRAKKLASSRWPQPLPKLVLGVTFNDGIEVIAKPTDRQPITAAA